MRASDDRTARPGRLAETVDALSHDLKAPTRHLAGFVQILEEELGDTRSQQVRHCLDVIVRSVATIDGTLDALQRYATVVGAAYDGGTGALADVVAQVVSGGVGPGPEVVIEDGGDVPVDGDRLVAVLTELVDNARRFCPPPAVVTVSASRDEAGVVVVVADNGPGLPFGEPAQALRLFRRLPTPRPAGPGVGLTIVRDLVEEMGGRVDVDAGSGPGARLTLRLPAGGRSRAAVDTTGCSA